MKNMVKQVVRMILIFFYQNMLCTDPTVFSRSSEHNKVVRVKMHWPYLDRKTVTVHLVRKYVRTGAGVETHKVVHL